MKENEFKQLKNLISVSQYRDQLEALFNAGNSLEYRCIKMTREYFLDVFGVRLDSNKSRGIIIKGFAAAYTAFENSSAGMILSHGLEAGDNSVLIYTNIEITEIFGMLEPNEVTLSGDTPEY